jgi:soluble lytic murein transglycosylase
MTVFVLVSAAASGQEPDFSALKNNPTPVAAKLLTWFTVTETGLPFSSHDLIRFSLENSGWPKLYEFRNRIERDADNPSLRAPEIAAWFDQNPPRTAKGFKAYMTALLGLGQNARATLALKKFWLDAELDKKETAALAAQYKRLFSVTDHADRLDNLLWEQRYEEAESMLPLVDKDTHKLGEARIALGRLSSKSSKLISAVPAALQKDSGLLYDRLRWRRQTGKDIDAVEILRHAPKNLRRADLWWKERSILARRAIEKKDFAAAYKITANNGLTDGADYAQAEWTLGWLMLEFLGQPDKAYQHFDNFYQAVSSAVSRARAAWWLSRAAEKLNHPEDARNWAALGAHFPSTFYGQLCHEKNLGAAEPSQFLDDDAPPLEKQAFDNKELVQVIRLLSRIGLQKYSDPFFFKLLEGAKTRSDFVLIAKLAHEINRLHFAVEANKQLQQKLGEFMFTTGYPMLPQRPPSEPESALIHAIVHRESMFDTQAESPAGARGLMQLMPGTAKQVSKKIGKNYTADKLTGNPQYNVELGAAYLQSLLDYYNGFYPLAIAAYNAGPGNVNEWIDEFGDPRSGKVNLIDWIEEIPIYETRNYIQRVMESYYIYKLRLSEKPKTILGFGKG